MSEEFSLSDESIDVAVIRALRVVAEVCRTARAAEPWARRAWAWLTRPAAKPARGPVKRKGRAGASRRARRRKG